jgi:hypothetical protein
MACFFYALQPKAMGMSEKITPKLYLKKIIYRASHWETWHWLIKYIPMLPFWAAYCIKARSPWFFTAANPTLTFGGFEGETKREMYALLPEGTFPRTFHISAALSISAMERKIQSSGLSFPIAVKPDVGRMGLMFRKINSIHQLRSYHRSMQTDYLVQEFIPYELEVSVFYYRRPDQPKGTITGFVKKEGLCVTGDGSSTLSELMLQYPRVWFRMNEMKSKHAHKLNAIIPHGQRYVLSHALNLSRGGKLVSLEHEKDESLHRLFDQLSQKANFYFGRYDIKCASIKDLKQGKNFSILEFNGSGAEPHHVYANGNSLFQAIKILLHHWEILYQISVANHKNGIPYWNFKRGLHHLRHAKAHVKMLRNLELEGSRSFKEITLQCKRASHPNQQFYPLADSSQRVNTNANA